MSNLEKIVPGCGNYDSGHGVCRLMYEKGVKPTLAQEAKVNPPGEIEGPGTYVIDGLICLAALKADEQSNCSHFTPRTEEDDIADYNL
jgi:hypothetical protein